MLNPDRPGCLTIDGRLWGATGVRVNERGVAAADRVVRLLRQLGIQRAHVVQEVAEAAAHPETVRRSR
jgi:hypothetical protein